MDPRHLEELATLEHSYWWHLGKRQLVLSLLARYFPAPARLLEGGVGSCGNLLAFRQAGYQVSGLDVLPAAVEHGRRLGLEPLWCHDLQQPWPVSDGPVDVVVLLDVLEHVQDPQLVLRHAADRLQSSGGAVVTVPAYPWLYGPWDESLGHYRRYTAGHLRADAEAAGFRVAWLSHWNVFSLPAAMLLRLWQRWRGGQPRSEFPRVSPLTNQALVMLAAAERGWLASRRLPAGLSLVGVLLR